MKVTSLKSARKFINDNFDKKGSFTKYNTDPTTGAITEERFTFKVVSLTDRYITIEKSNGDQVSELFPCSSTLMKGNNWFGRKTAYQQIIFTF
jgi:hypothetical protein